MSGIAVIPEQLDLLAELEQQAALLPAPTLYSSTVRGLAGRAAEYSAWRDAFGTLGSSRRSHAWTVEVACPGEATEQCQPTVLSADLRCDCPWGQPCFCVGDLMYRGACRGCAWEGPPCDSENSAAEDAHDHAWPGWRELPIVPAIPEERKKRAVWVEHATALYPAGWLERGGPIRTERRGGGMRHVPNWTPFGGYDMAVAA